MIFFKYILLFYAITTTVLAQTTYKKKEFDRTNGLLSDFVYDITSSTNGKIWIATDEGLNVFNGKEFTSYNKDNSGIKDNYIKHIIIEDSLLQVHYSNHGVSIHLTSDSLPLLMKEQSRGLLNSFSLKKEDKVKKNEIGKHVKDNVLKELKLTEKDINVFFTDIKGSYWVGTKGDGLIHIEDQGVVTLDTSYSSGQVFHHSDSCYYTNKGQLYLLNNEELQPITDLPVKTKVVSLILSVKDSIVVGEQGIYNLNSTEPFISINDITAAIRHQNTLVVGTLNKGIYFIEDEKIVKKIQISDGLSHSKVNHILALEDELWIATASGVSLIKNKSVIKTIKGTENYEWRKLMKIREALYGFTLQSGVFKLNKNKSDYILDYENQIFKGVYKYEENCIIVFSNGLHHWSLRSIKKMVIPYGQFYTPITICEDYLISAYQNSLFASSLLEHKSIPNFEITKVNINGKRMAIGQETLSAGSYDFQFNLAPIYFSIGQNLVYSYRINDKSWSPYTSTNMISIMGVDKSFKLEIVAAVEGNEVLQSKLMTYNFVIGIPFWKKPITILITVIICLFIYTLFFLYRSKAIQRRNKELMSLVEEKTSEIVRDKEVILIKNQELNLLKTAVDQTVNSLVVFDEKGNIEYGNYYFYNLFQITPNSIISKTVFDYFKIIEADFKLLVDSNFKEPLERKLGEEKSKASYYSLTITPVERGKENKLFILLAQNITKSKEIEKSLKVAKDNAEMSEIAKELALSSMSHEIRNPITAIVGMSQILAEKEKLSKKEKKLTQALRSAALTLLSLVNNSLFLGKKEAGVVRFISESFSIKSVTESVSSNLYYQAEEKGLKIKVINNLDFDYYDGDNIRLTQVLLNLVGNAIKFSDKGEVLIGIEQKENCNYLSFSVSDSGIGMNSVDVSNAFSRYSQFGKSPNSKELGTGLGLSICKEIIEAQKGVIKIETEYKKGTKVSFTLPYSRSINLPEPIEVKSNNVFEEINILTILIVEDNEFNQLYLSHLLEKWGHKIYIASTAKQAEELALSIQFDIILLDIQLPDKNGKEVAECIKAAKLLNNETPIIAMSGNVQNDSKKELELKIFSDYIQKPFKAEDLLSLVVKFSKKSRLLRVGNYIDLNKVRAIIGEDEELLISLLESFYKDYPLVVIELYKSIETLNIKEFENKCHVLKSTLGYFNLNSQITVIYEVLDEIKNSNKQSAIDKLIIFEEEMMCVMLEIEQLIKKLF